MPGKNGFEAVTWLNANFPLAKILAVSKVEKDEWIVSYLSKDEEPKEPGEAIGAVLNKGFDYTDFIAGKLVDPLITVTIIKALKRKPSN